MTSSAPLLRFLGAPLWSGLADAHLAHRLVIAVSLSVGAALHCLVPLAPPSLWALLPLYVLSELVWSAAAPLADSATLLTIEARTHPAVSPRTARTPLTMTEAASSAMCVSPRHDHCCVSHPTESGPFARGAVWEAAPVGSGERHTHSHTQTIQPMPFCRRCCPAEALRSHGQCCAFIPGRVGVYFCSWRRRRHRRLNRCRSPLLSVCRSRDYCCGHNRLRRPLELSGKEIAHAPAPWTDVMFLIVQIRAKVNAS